VRITDNSFIKVTLEQGIAVGLLFTVALITAIALVARRLRRVPGESGAIGIAALAGFVAFLGMSVTGEYIEQPGKVVAWALFGIATAIAFVRPRTREGRE